MGKLCHFLFSFIAPMAVFYTEHHKYDLVPDLRWGGSMCNGENEPEDPEQELVWPREALSRRDYAHKSLREMSLLAGLPHVTPRLPSHLRRVSG